MNETLWGAETHLNLRSCFVESLVPNRLGVTN